MFSKTINYVDFEGQPKSMVAWFHLARKAAIKDISIADDIQSVERIIKAEKHELTTAEKQTILDFIIKIIKLSYGVRSDDGTRFKQNNEVYEAFEESAAYGDFLVNLFDPDPEEAFKFILKALPVDIRAEIDSQKTVAPESAPITEVKETVEEDGADDHAAYLRWKQSQAKLEL